VAVPNSIVKTSDSNVSSEISPEIKNIEDDHPTLDNGKNITSNFKSFGCASSQVNNEKAPSCVD